MPLNIKDDDIHAKAKQIAALTGESITSIVRNALDKQMLRLSNDRLRSTVNPEVKAARLAALAQICAKNMATGANSASHAELYGSDGVPK